MTYLLRRFNLLLLVLVSLSAASSVCRQSDAAAPARVTFGGKEYLHRWSKAGQHEFTARGDENLERWNEMVTINIHEAVHDGDQLADIANRVVGNYQAHGRILRTNSIPRTPQRPAEHFVAATLGSASMLEAVFARFVLVDNVGLVAVYSRRFYGSDATKAMGEWVQANGPGIERMLMSWNGIPAPATLRRLPQSK